MRLRFTDLIAVALLAACLGGCSSSNELPKEQDQALRENFKRTMTEEEVARLKGQAQGGSQQGAPAGASTAPASGPSAD
ncbi:MAG: hypothetical protein LDL56_12045 [Armatimonadetes bacterium]|jgi:hypothetical protein|nr:hypothetical protein [Armatimonadota bacterium]MCA1997944.1 hypothetical protein [Armatimonadota bacterium]